MADLKENNVEILQAVNEGNAASNEDMFNIELDPCHEYRQEELSDMGKYIISTRVWFQDLEERKRRLNLLFRAQQRAYLEIRERKRKELAQLTKATEAAEATVKLMTGLYSTEEKDELVQIAKGMEEFEEIYNKYVRMTKKQEIIERVAQFQRKKIEELKAEHSKLNEELREVKKSNSWKKIFLSLYCARTEED